MIIDAQLIGGVGMPAIFDGRWIGGIPGGNKYKDIASYTLSPQGESHVFEYPEEKFITVYDGAQLQLPVPPGIAPFIYSTSDFDIATVDVSGRVKFHNTGTVTFLITDSEGTVWG